MAKISQLRILALGFLIATSAASAAANASGHEPPGEAKPAFSTSLPDGARILRYKELMTLSPARREIYLRGLGKILVKLSKLPAADLKGMFVDNDHSLFRERLELIARLLPGAHAQDASVDPSQRLQELGELMRSLDAQLKAKQAEQAKYASGSEQWKKAGDEIAALQAQMEKANYEAMHVNDGMPGLGFNANQDADGLDGQTKAQYEKVSQWRQWQMASVEASNTLQELKDSGGSQAAIDQQAQAAADLKKKEAAAHAAMIAAPPTEAEAIAMEKPTVTAATIDAKIDTAVTADPAVQITKDTQAAIEVAAESKCPTAPLVCDSRLAPENMGKLKPKEIATIKKELYAKFGTDAANLCMAGGLWSSYKGGRPAPGKCQVQYQFCYSKSNCSAANGVKLKCTAKGTAICSPLLFGVQKDGHAFCERADEQFSERCERMSDSAAAGGNRAYDFLNQPQDLMKERWDNDLENFTRLCSGGATLSVNCRACQVFSREISSLNYRVSGGKCGKFDLEAAVRDHAEENKVTPKAGKASQ